MVQSTGKQSSHTLMTNEFIKVNIKLRKETKGQMAKGD